MEEGGGRKWPPSCEQLGMEEMEEMERDRGWEWDAMAGGLRTQRELLLQLLIFEGMVHVVEHIDMIKKKIKK